MFRPLLPHQRWIDLAIAAVFLVLVTWVGGPGTSGSGLSRFGVVVDSGTDLAIRLSLGLVFAAALAFRRLAPGLSLAIAWAGAVVQMALGLQPLLLDVAIFAVLFAAAAYGSRLIYWLGFASAIGGALVIVVYMLALVVGQGVTLDLGLLSTGVIAFFAAAFALGLAWTAGALLRVQIRARENRAAQERAELTAAEEQQRVRIARDMHDVVAHSLAVVIAQADGARYAAQDRDATEASLATISATARAALADVRVLLAQLRHSETDGPQPTIADLDALYERFRAADLELTVDVDPAPSAPPPAAVQLAVYRILQEALTNALRHGAGSAVAITQAWLPHEVSLTVRNARAAAPAGTTGQTPRGHGLIGMRERAHLVGGTLDAGPRGDDFVVEGDYPVRRNRVSIRVVLVDDQSLFRAGIRLVIDSQPDLEVVGEASNGQEALEVVPRIAPDVVLMDIRMPVMDGLAATEALLQGGGDARIVVLTTFDLDESVARALRAGASGFLLKDADPEFLLAAIRTVHAGSSVVAASATRELFRQFAPPEKAPPAAYAALTEREREIFALAARGLSNAEIATAEFLSEATVKTHISRILAKLGLRDRVQLVVFAFEHGLAAA